MSSSHLPTVALVLAYDSDRVYTSTTMAHRKHCVSLPALEATLVSTPPPQPFSIL